MNCSKKRQGLAGKTETELKTALQTKLDAAVANASTGVSAISTQLREQLITLTKQQADVTDDALLQAVLNHSTTTAEALSNQEKQLQQQAATLAEALHTAGVPFGDAEGRDKPFNELVALAKEKITQTSEPNAGLQEAIQTAYAQLQPNGKETEIAQQLEALQQVGQRMAEQEVKYKETLKAILKNTGLEQSTESLSIGELIQELQIRVFNQGETLKTTQQEAHQDRTALTQVNTVLTATQKQLRQVLAVNVNNIGTELATKYIDISRDSRDKYKLRGLVESQLEGCGLTMEDVQAVLKQGFHPTEYTIEGASGVYGKEVGFDGNNPTKLSKVAYLLSNIIRNFDTTSQLSQQEHTLIINWLEALLKHPDVTKNATVLKNYRQNALVLDEHFTDNVNLLRTVSDIVTTKEKQGLIDNPSVELCNTLLTHPHMAGLSQNENAPVRQALEGVMPTLIQELKENPQKFHAAEPLNSMEVILSRAIELATKEQLLQNLANYQPFFVENEQITKDFGREALLTHLHKQVLLPNRGVLDELTGSPAKKLTNTSIGTIVANLSDKTSEDDYNLFSDGLIKEFAKQFFPEMLAEFETKHTGTRLFNAETPNILELLNKRIPSLDEKKPHELKLKGAIEALNDIYQESVAMETWSTEGGEVPSTLKIPDDYVRTSGVVTQKTISPNQPPKRPRSLYSSNQTNAT